jgi:predicted nucleic acid-binding protein
VELEPLLDTNVFIHAASTDEHSEECRTLLAELQYGRRFARLEILVVHELTYTLPRYLKQASKFQIVNLILAIVEWPGIVIDKPMIRGALIRWRDTQGLSFTDAYLAQRAESDGCAIYSKNVRELRAQGAVVPDPLIVSLENER